MPVPLTPVPGRALLRDDVHDRLRDAIVDGTFEPGEQLRDHELAAWLGVSRTPVREALLKLQQSGLVATRPGRSTTVTAVDEQSVREARSVVAAMHELAVRGSVAAMTQEHLGRLREANERFARAIASGDVEAALTADDEFHRVPVEVCGNGAAAAVLDQFIPSLRRAERLRFASHTGQDSVERHARLIELIAARDVETAARAAADIWHHLETDARPDTPIRS